MEMSSRKVALCPRSCNRGARIQIQVRASQDSSPKAFCLPTVFMGPVASVTW